MLWSALFEVQFFKTVGTVHPIFPSSFTQLIYLPQFCISVFHLLPQCLDICYLCLLWRSNLHLNNLSGVHHVIPLLLEVSSHYLSLQHYFENFTFIFLWMRSEIGVVLFVIYLVSWRTLFTTWPLFLVVVELQVFCVCYIEPSTSRFLSACHDVGPLSSCRFLSASHDVGPLSNFFIEAI